MKQNLIIIIIILLAAAAGLYLFTKDEISFSKESPVYRAVPITAPFFLEFKSLKAVSTDYPAIKELIRSGIANSFFSVVEKTDSIIRSNSDISNGLRNDPFLLSFDFTGRNELVPLLIKKYDNNNNRKALESLISGLFPPGKYDSNEKTYSNYKITEISAKTKIEESPVFYSFSEGLLLVSSKAIVVEKAIRQLSTKGILRNPYFLKVNKTVTANSEISWYINHRQFPVYLKNLINNKSTRKVDEFGETVTLNYQKIVQKFNDFSSWSELDVDFNENLLTLGGISVADDSLNHFLSVFEDQQPIRYRAEEVLPQNTSFWCNYAFSDKEKFFERLEAYFTHTDFYYQREERIKKMESGFRADLKSVFEKIVKDEVIVATTTIPVDPDNKISFCILHTEGKSNAEEQLISLLTNYANRKEIALNDLKSKYIVDDELAFAIYKFPYPSFPGIWLGEPFSVNKGKYVAFYGNYMIFANSEKGLQQYLHSLILDATLAKDIRYQRLKQNISNRSNMNVFVDVNRAFSLGKHIFSENISSILEEKEETIRKFWAVNWQVQRDKDVFFNSVVIGFNQKAKEEAQTTWQSTIGSQVKFKPQIVVNHNDTKNREIILQDEMNNLHQITKEGRIRWSVELPEKIMSEIHQVDYYKNGKLQYLFNTKEKLFLLDRDGNNVAHFPITLRSPATNGVNVFDYENTRNYRYFIAGEDKRIYAYDYSGNIVRGWEFDQTDHPVFAPVQHFRIGRNDYIVFKDKSRIYILDRRGEPRVKTSARFENSKNPLVLNLDGTPKIVATDTEGKVYYLFFDGKYSTKDVGNFGEDHFFTCDDLNGNGVPDFVFLDGNELRVTDENGKKLYVEKFGNSIQQKPNIFTFGPKTKKVGIVESAANRIYLYNPDGELHDGFPLQGNSEFSIGVLSENTGQLNLIVGSEGGSLFNYTLN